MASMEGKLALITGGGSGIGRSVCQLLDREGARVAVADLNLPAAQETVNMLKNPKNHLAVHMDVASKDSVTKGIEAVKEAFGATPSLLAHCAAFLEFVLMEFLEEKDFDRMINVTLKGTFLVTQALAKALKAERSKQGSFVLMSSVCVYNSHKVTGHYSAAKAGVISLTKTFARELADNDIRVNTVLPGLTETKIMDSEFMQLGIKETLPKLAIKRVAHPEGPVYPLKDDADVVPRHGGFIRLDVAEVVVFLLSERSRYVTGAEYRVDGGYNI